MSYDSIHLRVQGLVNEDEELSSGTHDTHLLKDTPHTFWFWQMLRLVTVSQTCHHGTCRCT